MLSLDPDVFKPEEIPATEEVKTEPGPKSHIAQPPHTKSIVLVGNAFSRIAIALGE